MVLDAGEVRGRGHGAALDTARRARRERVIDAVARRLAARGREARGPARLACLSVEGASRPPRSGRAASSGCRRARAGTASRALAQIFVAHHDALAVGAEDQQIVLWLSRCRALLVERVEVLRRADRERGRWRIAPSQARSSSATLADRFSRGSFATDLTTPRARGRAQPRSRARAHAPWHERSESALRDRARARAL